MKNKLKKLLSIVAVGSLLNVFGQSPQWLFANTNSFPTRACVFNQIPFVQNTNFPASPLGVTNTMVTDATGKRLFALLDDEGHNEINGQFGNMVYYETRTTASPYVATFKTMGYTEKIVVPAPKQEGGLDCNRYFVLQMGPYINRNWKYTYGSDNATSSDVEPYYSIVNMKTNNNDEEFEVLQTKTSGGVTYNCTAKPLMDLVPGLYSAGTNNPANNSPNTFMAISTKLRSDNTYLLFVSYNEKLYSFVVAYNGVSYGSLIQTLASVNNSNHFAGEMELYDLGSNGYKLAYPTYPIGGGAVQINMCEVTTAGVLKTSPAPSLIQLNYNGNYPVVHGLEFSPDGSYLYVTHETNTSHPNPIEFSAFGATSLSALSSAPSNKSSFARGQIQLNKVSGTDYLYFTSGTELARLSNCNVPSSTTWSVVANNASNGYSNVLGNVWDQLHGNLLTSTYTSYMLPDYADHMNYLEIYEEDVCCLEYKANLNIKENITLPVGTYAVNSTSPNNVLTCTITGSSPTQTVSVVFTPTTTIDGNITIPNGAKVTFQNLRMEFSERAAMIVNANSTVGQQGGKVVLNATTLTAFTQCNPKTMWPGVTLNGINNIAQGSTSNTQHAVLTTVGVSEISRALVALNIKGGAIVQYTGGSKLLDNKIAIEAETYTYNASLDVGYFNNAIIKTQSSYSIIKPLYLARISNRIPTMRFQNCTFIDDNSTYVNLYDGIVSIDSKVTVSSNSTFSNLDNAIKHTNTAANGIYKLTVQNSVFNKNLTGVYNSSSNFAYIFSNTFNLLDNNIDVAYSIGLYLEKSSKFIVKSNTFKNYSLSTANLGVGSIGIIANNTNKDDNNINFISQNTFLNLHEGIQCLNKNFYPNGGNPLNDRGLRIYCNSFSQTIPWTDIGVHAPTGADPSAVDYHQGQATDTAAANSFSHYTSNDYFHYPTTTYAVDYKWHSSTTNGLPNIPSGTYPVLRSQLTTNNNTCGAGGGGQRIGGELSPELMLEIISTLNSDINTIAGVANRDDGSDTASTSNEQLSSLQAQLDALETELIIYYLNDTIITAANDSAAKYILFFNQDAPSKGSLIDAYLAKGNYKTAMDVYEQMIAQEGESNYQKIYKILLDLYGKNISNELMNNSTLLTDVTNIANDRSDEVAYLIAQNLLGYVDIRTHRKEIQSLKSLSAARTSSELAVEKTTIFNLSNFPNPFTGTTTLTAFVPKGSVNATIVITDVLGKVVANYNLTEGNNAVQFDKQEAKGILYYSLFIDGQRKETKMMMKQ